MRDWNAKEAVKAELQPGEIINWTGKPTFLPMLKSKALVLLIGASIVAVAINGYLQDTATNTSSTALSHLAILVVISIAVIGRPLWEVLATSRTIYAVTNQRILIAIDLLSRRVLFFGPADINALEMSEEKDGSGSIVFRQDIKKMVDGDIVTEHAFIGIADVARATAEIEKLRLTASPAAPADSSSQLVH